MQLFELGEAKQNSGLATLGSNLRHTNKQVWEHVFSSRCWAREAFALLWCDSLGNVGGPIATSMFSPE